MSEWLKMQAARIVRFAKRSRGTTHLLSVTDEILSDSRRLHLSADLAASLRGVHVSRLTPVNFKHLHFKYKQVSNRYHLDTSLARTAGVSLIG